MLGTILERNNNIIIIAKVLKIYCNATTFFFFYLLNKLQAMRNKKNIIFSVLAFFTACFSCSSTKEYNWSTCKVCFRKVLRIIVLYMKL